MARRPAAPFALDAVEEFLRTKQAKADATLRSYQGVLLGAERGTKPSLGTPLAGYFKNRRMATLTHDDVAAWFTQRVANGSQSTKHRVAKFGRQFLMFAHARGYTNTDLSSAIDRYAEGEPRRDWLEWPDVHRLLASIPEFRLRFAGAWLFLSGCRVSEATATLQNDVRYSTEMGIYHWTIPFAKTHRARQVWLPEALTPYIEESRALNNPHPHWPLLWDCHGRGFARVESADAAITAATINGALDRARDAARIPTRVTAHVARHSYCTNWIRENGSTEHSMERLSRQVGVSIEVLRRTYVHVDYTPDDWAHIRGFGRHPAPH